MAKKYMNRFSIEEDDQFEIHVKEIYMNFNDDKAMYKAVKEVMLEAQQGWGYYRLRYQLKIIK